MRRSLSEGRSPSGSPDGAEANTLRGTLDGVPTPLVLFDGQGRARHANRAARDLLGDLATAPLARWLASCRFRTPEGRALEAEELPPVGTLRDHGARRGVEVHLADSHGKTRPLLMSSIATLDPTGQVQTVGVTLTCIESRCRRELERERSLRLDTLGRMARTLAGPFHDALTVIAGYCDVLGTRLDAPSPLREVVDEIHAAAARAGSMATRLLAHAQQEVATLAPLDVDDWLRHHVSVLRAAAGETVALHVETDANGARVDADRRLLQQVLVDLVANAREAMPDGGTVSVRTRTVKVGDGAALADTSMPPGRYVVLEVADEGTGMDDRMVPLIFEPFFTTRPRSLGLGLTTVQRIVRAHGGHIRVERRRREGTSFLVHLPARTGAALVADGDGDLDGRALTVLVVEDDPVVRDLLRHALEQAGCRVIEAANADAAKAACSDPSRRIDALVGDVVVPGGGGLGLLDRLRDDRPDLPALLVSGCSDRELLRPILDRDDVGFLAKPFGPSALLASLQRVLRPTTAEPTASTNGTT